MNVWYWIGCQFADGATHMATDQMLLEYCHQIKKPIMRVYRWNPYCISLGYHQSEHCIGLDKCQEEGIDVVRRPTGGRAVLHAEELTYSVVIPRSHAFFSTNIRDVYSLVNRGLTRGIGKLGVSAQLKKQNVDQNQRNRDSLAVSCFSSTARYEVVVEGKKLIGSAQRCDAAGVLQHGSILTGHVHLALLDYLKDVNQEEKKRMKEIIEDRTTTIKDCISGEVNYEYMVGCIKQGMEEEFSVRFENLDFTDKGKNRIRNLVDHFIVRSGTLSSFSG
jgi:lipoate-protein ligase A